MAQPTDRKAEIQRLVVELQSSTSHESQQIVQLAKLMFEDARDALVNASQADLPVMQGRAQALEGLVHKLITPLPKAIQERIREQ